MCRAAAGCAAADAVPGPPLLQGRWPRTLPSSVRGVWAKAAAMWQHTAAPWDGLG